MKGNQKWNVLIGIIIVVIVAALIIVGAWSLVKPLS